MKIVAHNGDSHQERLLVYLLQLTGELGFVSGWVGKEYDLALLPPFPEASGDEPQSYGGDIRIRGDEGYLHISISAIILMNLEIYSGPNLLATVGNQRGLSPGE